MTGQSRRLPFPENDEFSRDGELKVETHPKRVEYFQQERNSLEELRLRAQGAWWTEEAQYWE